MWFSTCFSLPRSYLKYLWGPPVPEWPIEYQIHSQLGQSWRMTHCFRGLLGMETYDFVYTHNLTVKLVHQVGQPVTPPLSCPDWLLRRGVPSQDSPSQGCRSDKLLRKHQLLYFTRNCDTEGPFTDSSVRKESACNAGRPQFDSWVRKISTVCCDLHSQKL